jgi:trans-aconitate methyltransferase
MTQVPDFDALYRADDDPWRVASSWYERRKLAVLLAALVREHYRRVWEPGCGIGVATTALASRAGEVVASDSSAVAVERARRRTAHLSNVRVEHSSLPEVPLDGTVDLVVAAEFLFYLDDLPTALDALWSVCAPGTQLVFVHWAHRPHDAFLSGRETQEAVRGAADASQSKALVRHHDADFLLDVYEATR